jgi:antitoxin (DNA-binding transcriptional repressor) of toxin-antitoxin stability system
MAIDQGVIKVTLDQIQQNLPAYLQRVSAGETFIVTQGDKSLAEIKPVDEETNGLRPFGLCAGQLSISDDFDAPLPEDILQAFEGR